MIAAAASLFSVRCSLALIYDAHSTLNGSGYDCVYLFARCYSIVVGCTFRFAMLQYAAMHILCTRNIFFFYVSHEFFKRICSFLCFYLLLLFACRCRSLLFFRKYLFSCVTLSISVYFFVLLLLFGWFVCCSSTNCTVFFIAIGNNLALYVEMDTKILLWSEIASIACNGNAL